MKTRTNPPMLKGCDVLPPMETGILDSTDNGVGERAKRKPNHRKTANRFVVLNSFVDCTVAELTRAEIAVWLVLYRDTRNGIAGTSQANIALRAGIKERTVRRAIKRLEGRELLKVVYRGGLNRGTAKYRIFGTPT